MNNEKSSLDQKIDESNASGDLSENNPEHEMASSANEQGLDCVRMDEESIKTSAEGTEARSQPLVNEEKVQSETVDASKMTVGQFVESVKKLKERRYRAMEKYSGVVSDCTPVGDQGASAIETESTNLPPFKEEEVQAETEDTIKRARKELIEDLMKYEKERLSFEILGHRSGCERSVNINKESREEDEARSQNEQKVQSKIEDTTEMSREFLGIVRKCHELRGRLVALDQRVARHGCVDSVKIDEESRGASAEETESRSQPSQNEEEVQPKSAAERAKSEVLEAMRRFLKLKSRLTKQVCRVPSRRTDCVDSDQESRKTSTEETQPLNEEETQSKLEDAIEKSKREVQEALSQYQAKFGLGKQEKNVKSSDTVDSVNISQEERGRRHSISSSSSSSSSDYVRWRFYDSSDSDSIDSFLNNDFPSDPSDWSIDEKIPHPHGPDTHDWNHSSADSEDSIWDTPRCSTGERRFKVLIIGDAGVGKTSIIKKYCINAALGDYRATIGMDYFSKKLILEDNTQVYLHIWDIAGGGRLGTMTRLIYRGAHGAMVVCDATRRVTIQNAVRWKDDLDEKTCLPDGGPIPCVFLANKCDLEVNSVVRNDSEMKRYCMKNRLLTWFETSAKDGTGIKEAFDLLAKEMMKNKRDDFGMTQPEVIRLSSETTTMKKKSKCLCS